MSRKILAILALFVFLYLGIGAVFHFKWISAQTACREMRRAQGEFVEPEVFGGALGLFFNMINWPIYGWANIHHDGTPFSTPCTHSRNVAPSTVRAPAETLTSSEGKAAATRPDGAAFPTVTPAPNFPMMGVHTPEDVEQYFAQWPDEHKLRLADDVVVLFTYPHPLANWVAGAIIYHIPSVSVVHLDFDGSVMTEYAHYESQAGQTHLEEILADEELLKELQAHVIGQWEQVLGKTLMTATSIPDITPEPMPTSSPAPTAQNGANTLFPMTSPNDQWQIVTRVSDPVPAEADETEQFPNGKYRVEMIVERADGSQTWTVVDEWRGYGLGWTSPQPVRWSADGHFLYFTNVPVPNGCSIFVNGGDLWRLDLNSGAVTEVASYIGLAMALSPDETQLAVNASYGRGFLIRDLATGAEQPISLPQPDSSWQIGGLQWSPDGQHLLLSQAVNPCSPEMKTAVVRIDVNELSATTLLEPDERNFTLLEWVRDDEVPLQDRDGRTWYLEVFSGELAEEETAESPASGQRQTFTSQEYGFSLQYPPGWTPVATLPNQVSLIHAGDSIALRFGVRRVTEDINLVRSGVSAGNFVPKEPVTFIGQPISSEVLVYQGKDKAVFYAQADEIARGDLVFVITLESNQLDYEAIEIPPQIQAEADAIVASAELVAPNN